MKKKTILLVLIFFLAGCAVHLLPQISPEIRISSNGLIAEQTSEGITVAINTRKIKFTKFDKYTPIFLKIKNETDNLISFEYKDFTLKDETNNIFNPVPIKRFFGKSDYNQFGRVEYSQNIKKAVFPYYGDSKPFLLIKGKSSGKDGRGGSRVKKKFFFIPVYPYDFYGPFYPYDFYGRMFYYPFPYDSFYYDYNYPFYDFPPYNPYMPYSPSYGERKREVFYDPLPMDILPHREVSGYLYFPQILKTAKKEIKLSVDIKGAKRVMDFVFKIK